MNLVKNCDAKNMASPVRQVHAPVFGSELTPSQKVRISALRFLGKLPSIVKPDVATRHKRDVVTALARVLDDPKRSVRKEAVDAR